MSTSTMSSASRSTMSGTVSRTTTPVMRETTSARLSRCWMLSAVQTSMRASSSSSTSCQRLGWRLSGALVWASSSTMISLGRRRERAVEVELLDLAALPAHASCAAGFRGRGSALPFRRAQWVSTRPTTMSTPSCLQQPRRAAASRRSCRRRARRRGTPATGRACPSRPAPAARPGRVGARGCGRWPRIRRFAEIRGHYSAWPVGDRNALLPPASPQTVASQTANRTPVAARKAARSTNCPLEGDGDPRRATGDV